MTNIITVNISSFYSCGRVQVTLLVMVRGRAGEKERC